MKWAYRVLPTLSSLVVAAASFALSYVALRDVAADVEAVPPHLAFLVPVVIDGGVICASAVIWATAGVGAKRQWFPFFVVAALVTVSVVVNTAHAGPTPLAKIIAALPPLVLLATLELVAIGYRASKLEVSADQPAAAPGPTGATRELPVDPTVTAPPEVEGPSAPVEGPQHRSGQPVDSGEQHPPPAKAPEPDPYPVNSPKAPAADTRTRRPLRVAAEAPTGP